VYVTFRSATWTWSRSLEQLFTLSLASHEELLQSNNHHYKRLITLHDTQDMQLRLVQSQLNEAKTQLSTTK
jgi:hypothetical protein